MTGKDVRINYCHIMLVLVGILPAIMLTYLKIPPDLEQKYSFYRKRKMHLKSKESGRKGE
jgi:hypothetical protein